MDPRLDGAVFRSVWVRHTASRSVVPRLAVLSFVAAARCPFAFGQSGEGCQVGAGSRQVGAEALLLLAAALPGGPAHPVRPHQHAVTGVTVEVVLASH